MFVLLIFTGAHADAKETGGRSLLAQSLLNSSGHHNNNSQTEEDDEEVDFKVREGCVANECFDNAPAEVRCRCVH